MAVSKVKKVRGLKQDLLNYIITTQLLHPTLLGLAVQGEFVEDQCDPSLFIEKDDT